MADKKTAKGLLNRLRDALQETPDCDPSPAEAPFILRDDKLKLPQGNTALRLVLGKQGKHLDLLPDVPLDAGPDCRPTSYIICDPDAETPLSAPLRLRPGEKLMLGSKDELQQAVFQYPSAVEKRHLSIRYGKNALIFKDYGTGSGICITPQLGGKRPLCLPEQRLLQLQRLHKMLAGPITLLPRAEALSTLNAVNQCIKHEAMRPKTGQGKPGALLELPARLVPTIVADLHTRIDNLLNVLSRSNLLTGLKRGDACLVIIGDAVHSEQKGQLEDMQGSMLIMDLILRLKLLFPERVFYLRGNHDSFSDTISKAGVPQGVLWLKALRKARGKAYAKAMERFYRRLPLVMSSPRFISCHAGPPTSRCSREQLIDAYSDSKLVKQLLNNRLQRPGRPEGYTGGDIKRLRKCLQAEANVPVIVGHTPLDSEDTLWSNPRGIKNHYVLYSADDQWVGAIGWAGDQLVPLRYPAEKLLDVYNAIED